MKVIHLGIMAALLAALGGNVHAEEPATAGVGQAGRV